MFPAHQVPTPLPVSMQSLLPLPPVTAEMLQQTRSSLEQLHTKGFD